MPSASNPMQQAVFRGCVECIRMLVETPPYYSVDSCCGPDGLRPIHIASREGHIQTLRFLSAAGACLQRSDFNGCTALHHAAIAGQLRAVRWLLRHGAKILLDKRGRSPIQVAADHDHMEIVSVLAKHATSASNGTTLTTSHSRDNLAKSASNNNINTISNTEARRTSRRTASADRDRTFKDRSDFTTGSVDVEEDYSISSHINNTNHHNNPSQNNNNANHHNGSQPFSHLHLSSETESSSKVSTSPGDCASSSGNSSLTTSSSSTSAPSLSPSASSSSAASCNCSTSDDTTLIKSVVEVSDSFTLEEYQSKNETNAEQRASLSSPTPFFLHPPKDKEKGSDSQSQLIPDYEPTENVGTTTGGATTKKKSNHKRQASTALTSPFFLHPPENLVSETQKAVASKMAPAPVNPSHTHHHFADPINEPTPKLKVVLPGDTSSSASTSSSPPLSPPAPKGGSVSPVLNGINKFQPPRDNQINNKCQSPLGNINIINNNNNADSNDDSSTEVKIKNQINSNSSCVPPPPPPPPPLPFTTDSNRNHAIIPNGINGSHFSPRDMYRNGSASPSSSKNDGFEGENDYEDIDELTNGTNHYEQARKLLRSVSAPPPMNDNNGSNGQSTDGKSGPPGLPDRTASMSQNKPPIGCGKQGVPFIPPHFPAPPKDALIKPSEYLRSIQNKTKTNGANCAANINGGSIPRPSSRVEEALKALGVGAHDNHLGLMSPVPEETNAEDEFEEINPERINGYGKVNGYEIGIPPPEPPIYYGTTNGTDENNNKGGSGGGGGGIGSNGVGCGMIKAEELMKVHLRKTPMSRTKSAPPLGRVIPDDQVDAIQSQKCNQENGHEQLKRTSTTANVSSTCNGNGGSTEGATVSKAAVIAELAQSSQVGGVREWKEELRRRQKEQEKAVQKEIEQYYQPVNFVSEVPSTDVTGAPIPDWKRQMMARKAAERAKKEAEEQRRMEIEAKRMASIPMWRRQLLQRRESDGKYAQ